jgi:hypothetical protein
LERIGAFCDGGYLVDPRDIAVADGLISMGIAIDWSFEKSFAHRKAVPIRAYDGSLSIWYLMARVARDAMFLKGRQAFTNGAKQVVDYVRFFSGPIKHVRSYVGQVRAAYRSTSAPSVTLEQVFDEMRDMGSTKPFLKIDIEGSEYSLLDDLVKHANATAGLAIEFHESGKHMDEIIAFVNDYSLRIVHIHANNYTTVDERGYPGALEITFSSSSLATEQRPVLPHPLDSPNDGISEEIEIRFG